MAKKLTTGSLILRGIAIFCADIVFVLAMMTARPVIGFNWQTGEPLLFLIASWAGFWLSWRRWRQRDGPLALAGGEPTAAVWPPPRRRGHDE